MTDLSREQWYHGRISRVDAEKILEQMGAVEGGYLVRDSLSLTGEYVLSLCHQVRCPHTAALGGVCNFGYRDWIPLDL